jgi:hypothetical protein
MRLFSLKLILVAYSILAAILNLLQANISLGVFPASYFHDNNARESFITRYGLLTAFQSQIFNVKNLLQAENNSK